MARLRGLVGPVLAFLLAFALLIALGLWQLRRLTWKTELLAQIAERTTAPPQPLPPADTWPSLRPVDYAYRHVVLTGTFLHGDEAHVFRPLSAETARGPFHGLGDLVLTPLRLDDGRVVIVNRGFVPQDRLAASARPTGQIPGRVVVTGLMREPESRNPFTPADDPGAGTWFTRDPAAMAAWFHIEGVAPFTIDADAGALPGGLPQGGETVLDIPNNHLSYAMTWFGLAGGLCLVFAGVIWNRVVPRGAGPPDATAAKRL
ncbi:SURF1 family protein [Lichenihabitans sp. Uapishka_5]|uniref:SURF1 family protein n=1 Tax=Lichenihabitans sp. Uapishka_5 TaxID=3037302 RepID=UPI0029E7F8A4|nr:SURF1 family protein [Lichenihabitans sp. Uapishka_5]MDX7949756.1 SURF1 family protein [Lichenihabitans sp. Uapishka_5]